MAQAAEKSSSHNLMHSANVSLSTEHLKSPYMITGTVFSGFLIYPCKKAPVFCFINIQVMDCSF